MHRYIEISGKLQNNMWGYNELPGLEKIVPQVEIETIATVKNNGFFSSKITIASISGTYLESSSHMIENGRNLDEYAIEDFIKPACILRLPEQSEKALIDVDILDRYAGTIEKGEALIIDTGWWKMWNRPGYVLSCPNYFKSALEWILEKEISILGVDVPCIEASWSEENEAQKGSLLKEIFRRGVLLAAPLVNLGEVKKSSGTIMCLPLNVEGVSGAPARIIFEEEYR